MIDLCKCNRWRAILNVVMSSSVFRARMENRTVVWESESEEFEHGNIVQADVE